ncbi:MAG: hypothetical protein HFI39_11860 [Lachnospiraceae bacterium]|nr:hypothetical protein [Lachnospiraceae bacterium]
MIVSGKSYASEAVWGNDYISETYIVGEQIIRVELSESTRHKRYTYLSTGKVEDIFFDEDWHGAIVYDENGNRSYYSTDIEGNVYCDGIIVIKTEIVYTEENISALNANSSGWVQVGTYTKTSSWDSAGGSISLTALGLIGNYIGKMIEWHPVVGNIIKTLDIGIAILNTILSISDAQKGTLYHVVQQYQYKISPYELRYYEHVCEYLDADHTDFVGSFDTIPTTWRV